MCIYNEPNAKWQMRVYFISDASYSYISKENEWVLGHVMYITFTQTISFLTLKIDINSLKFIEI